MTIQWLTSACRQERPRLGSIQSDCGYDPFSSSHVLSISCGPVLCKHYKKACLPSPRSSCLERYSIAESIAKSRSAAASHSPALVRLLTVFLRFLRFLNNLHHVLALRTITVVDVIVTTVAQPRSNILLCFWVAFRT